MRLRDLPDAEVIDDSEELEMLSLELLEHLLAIESDIEKGLVSPQHIHMRLKRLLDQEY